MPIDRTLWTSQIIKLSAPSWPCPTCKHGRLTLIQHTYHSKLDNKYSREMNADNYNTLPETGVFTCILRCSQSTCEENCAVSGTYEIVDYDDGFISELVTRATPLSIQPPPPMIIIPERCPNTIRQEVTAAFALYWPDSSSSLNRIRAAVELLLTELKVPRVTRKKGKKDYRIPLDKRIEHLGDSRPSLKGLCNSLKAVKHLGNAGSHPGEVRREDVLDGFEILEKILSVLYSTEDRQIARIVNQINKRKGPRNG